MNQLPRKGMLIAVTLLLTWLFFVIAPFCWPFLLAMLFSMALEPLVRFCVTRFKRIKPPRGIVTLLGMILLFGILGVGLFALVRRLLHEIVSLAYATPGFVRWLSNTVVPYVQGVYQQYSDILPASAMTTVNAALSTLGENAIKLAGSLSATLTSNAMNVATSIPGILLSIVLTIMGTYYMTADRERILAFFRRTFPAGIQSHGKMLKSKLFRSLFGQVKSQLTVSMIIITFLVLAFVIYGIKFGLLMGFIIGIGDALPVIGAGLFLIPWSIFEALVGNYATSIFLGAVYIGTIIIRQISEPRIVGANLGLYPLATMVAIFAGFQLFGVLGLLGGPILLNLLKVVLEADDIARGVKTEPVRPRGRYRTADKRGRAADTDATVTVDAQTPEDTPNRSMSQPPDDETKADGEPSAQAGEQA